MEILIINGHDYSQYVKAKGYGWARNDIDSSKTTRTKDGKMRRYKITTKRKLSFSVFHMTRELLARLDSDLSKNTYRATYRDLHGTMTKEFYTSSFEVSMEDAQGDTDNWGTATFSMIEV